MFKRITIELTGPICDCDEGDLQWGVSVNAEGKSTLEISCRNCGTKLTVPHGRFLARFNLDRNYPGKKKATDGQDDDRENKRKPPDGDGKIIHFPTKGPDK